MAGLLNFFAAIKMNFPYFNMANYPSTFANIKKSYNTRINKITKLV
jgi:hypothetical protein